MTDDPTLFCSRLPGARDSARLVAAEGDDRLAVYASSGVAAAWGFHHYLKYLIKLSREAINQLRAIN